MKNEKQFFHLCSDGKESRDFITSNKDFVAAMNIIAVCAANTEASVIAFSLQDTHYHFLLYGEMTECIRFRDTLEKTYRHYVSASRKDTGNAVPAGELYPIGDNDYLMNAAIYTIIQPTKDKKPVMPFDYPWGSGSLYFRCRNHIHIWHLDDEGNTLQEITFGSLTSTEKRKTLHSHSLSIPEHWLICGGIILPQNYVDITLFESIFKTHNCYRVFLGNSSKKEEEILMRMAQYKGITIEDTEARRLGSDTSKEMFGTSFPRRLTPHQKIKLAQNLHRKHNISYRQIASIVNLPEDEIRRYTT